MYRLLLTTMALWLVLAALPTFAQVAQPPATVTIDVTEKSAAEVAAELTTQSGVQIGVVSPCAATVTLKLDGAKTEDAVKAFAEAFNASWLRAYVLEKQPPATPFTADQLLAGLQNQRDNWNDSFTDDERRQMMEDWRAAREARGENAAPMPGAGRSTLGRRPPQGAPNAEGQPAQPGQPAQGAQPGQGGGPEQRGMGLFDPVAQVILILPVRTESITLSLADEQLAQALFDLTTAGGFLVAATPDLTGAITLEAQDKPIDEVLTQIGTAVGGKWRPIYLLALPRQLTEGEQEQMMEARETRGWARFWAKTPEERKQDVERRVQGLQRFAEMARQPGQDGQPNRMAGMFQRFAPRMLNRMGRYSSTLTPEQRREISPLIRALGKALGQNQ